MIRIVLAEDQALVLGAIAALLALENDFAIVGRAAFPYFLQCSSANGSAWLTFQTLLTVTLTSLPVTLAVLLVQPGVAHPASDAAAINARYLMRLATPARPFDSSPRP